VALGQDAPAVCRPASGVRLRRIRSRWAFRGALADTEPPRSAARIASRGNRGHSGARPAIKFRDRRAFWFGTGAVIAGVVLHLPMFLGARDMQCSGGA
jgi:hypothetical protein